MNGMVIIIILLLISSACMAIVAVRSGKKEPKSSGRPPRPVPERPVSVIPPERRPERPGESGLSRTRKTSPDGPGLTQEAPVPSPSEDIDILYQYSREYPVWVCSFCETENRLEQTRCAVCNERNDRG